MDFAIIAAGAGSRLVSEGSALPKPLVSLCGEPMIGRLLGILADAGAETVRVIVNEDSPEVESYIRSFSFPARAAEGKSAPEIALTVRSTAGSMESFRELARGMNPDAPFCLLTVDSVFKPMEFLRFIEEFEADADADADGHMAVTTYIADEKPLYVATDPADNITGFLDTPVEGVRYVSGGIYALRPPAIELLEDCTAAGKTRMRDYQRALLASGMRLKARPFSRIIDVDRLSDLEAANRWLNR